MRSSNTSLQIHFISCRFEISHQNFCQHPENLKINSFFVCVQCVEKLHFFTQGEEKTQLAASKVC